MPQLSLVHLLMHLPGVIDTSASFPIFANPSSGAWHGSDIASVFGTAGGSGGANTLAETAIVKYVMGGTC